MGFRLFKAGTEFLHTLFNTLRCYSFIGNIEVCKGQLLFCNIATLSTLKYLGIQGKGSGMGASGCNPRKVF